MNKEQFLDVMDDIGDDLIENFLDIPSERFYIPKRTPFWKIALSAAAAVCIFTTGIFVVKFRITQSSATSSNSGQQTGAEIINSDNSASPEEFDEKTVYEVNDRTGKWFCGKIYYKLNSEYCKSFYASTGKNSNAGYIYADVLLENAFDNAEIGSAYACVRNMDSVDTHVDAQYGTVQQVMVIGTHKSGYSDDELQCEFHLHKLFEM